MDRSKRIAAHIQLSVGNRRLSARVVKATLAHDELVFELALDADPPRAPSALGSRRRAPTRC